ncbi:BTAD domain-containing putative transcriptional regulator [Promineifilum sp.]|uniref:AfsR/SARP family transcriptional regulator n=1 Tax=Promineifilum sp. TaxID=2664178 RepID=UPI0035B479A2
MTTLRLFLFGAPRLEREGEAVALRRSRGLALLAYLAVTRQPHTREALTTLLWPDFDPEGARNNLRRELSLLKAALGEGVLVAERDLIALDPGVVEAGRLWIDVAAFEAGIETARTHVHEDGEHCPVCTRALEETAALYSDHFLTGFSLPDSQPFNEWQYFRGEQYRGAAAAVFRRLTAWHEGRGEYDSALDYARRWLALDTLHEPAHRALMQLYEASGQHAAALRQYETLRRALSDELGALPETETEVLHEAIKSHNWSPAQASEAATRQGAPAEPLATGLPNNLPADTTLFIGRRSELEQLDTFLSDPAVRLITIAGPGGSGKTRLALAAARRLVERTPNGSAPPPDGVFLVPLAAVDSAAQIAPAIGRALGLSLHDQRDPLRELTPFLRPSRLLLVVDNLEHLLADGAAQVLGDVLTVAPDVRMLVTSRMQMRIRGEHLLALSGLDIATTPPGAVAPPDGMADDALALFVAVARAIRPDFAAEQANLRAAARICRHVQGLPLAIELAAGWLTVLGAEEIAAELETSLDLLDSPWEDVPARQSSLRAVFDTSWNLLSADEQAVLRALTVFRGGFDRDAACAVADASLKTIAALVAKSWLRPVGGERLQMHELLRQYAAQELDRLPAEGNPRQRHAEYYAGLVESQLARLRGPLPAAGYALLERETDNINTALAWLVEHGRLETVIDRMLPALFRYLESRFHYFQFYQLRDLAFGQMRAAEVTRETAILFICDSAFFFNGYPTRFIDYQWIDEVLARGIKLAWEALDTPPGQEGFWDLLLAWEYGHFVDARAGAERLRRATAALDPTQRLWERAFAQQCLGRLLTRTPEVAQHKQEAIAALHDARELFKEVNDRREVAVSLLFLGYENQAKGRIADARTVMNDAQTWLRQIGDDIMALNINWVLADIHMQLGEVERALTILVEMADALIAGGHAQLAIDALSRAAYDSVRYRHTDEALPLRERSLALSRAFGYRNYESWDTWEMGELYRVRGDATEARQWFDRANTLFEQARTNVGRSFYHRGLGDLALAAGDAAEAARQFEISRGDAAKTNHAWQLAYVTAGLGRAATMTGDYDVARRHLVAALRGAQAIGDGGLVTAVLRGAVEWFAALGRDEDAAAAATIILKHPLAWRETRRAVMALTGQMGDATDFTAQPLFDLKPLVSRVLTKLEVVELTGGLER